MILRDYQQKAVASVFDKWQRHVSTLGVAATGCGKTIIFANVIAQMQPKRALVLAHRDELIIQAKDKIEQVAGLAVEIEKADLYASTSLFHKTPVVVSSIQTQISGPKDRRRYLRFKPTDFGVLICDEVHHATSKSWKEVINYYRQNPDLRVLGVTATPDRADQEALGQVLESVAFEYGILDAIQDGWLVDITQQFVSVSSLDYSHVRTTAGDLNEGDLAKVMEMEENIQGICQPTLEVMHGLEPKTLAKIPVPEWRDYLGGLGKTPRRTIIFTVSVAQAEMGCNVLSRAIDGVEWVCGATAKEKRRATLTRFAKGETHAVFNCGVLLEGFDNPGVEVIAMARPTKSRALYTQAIGRSTRPLPGLVDGIETSEGRRAAIAASAKPFCRILDFVGNSGRHKLISCADVLGGKITPEAIDRAKAKAIEEGKPVKIMVTMTNAEIELQQEKEKAAELARQRAAARKAHLLARAEFRSESIDPFSEDGYRPAGGVIFSRDGKRFSEKQIATFRQAGYDPSHFGYKQGQAIIGKILAEPSEKQLKVIRRAGANPEGWSRKECSKFIDKLAKNNWKLPPPEPNQAEKEAAELAEYIR